SAVQSLGRHKRVAKTAIESLTKAVNDDHPNVRKYAIGLLGELGPDAKVSIKTLVAVLNDRDPFIRSAAIESLGKMGPEARPAVPALTALLTQTNAPLTPEAQKVIERAAKALNRSPGEGINLAVAAAIALEQIDPGKTPARELLMASLKDKKTELEYRVDAAGFLAVKAGDKTALLMLIEHTKNRDRTARRKAAYALARLGRSEAVPPLIEDLSFDNHNTRLEAAAALGNLGPAAKTAIPALVAASEQPFDAALRKKARSALEKIRKK
ncbi:HEAT repeat domain-containing protein, partial [Acidobacteriota bacterium]